MSTLKKSLLLLVSLLLLSAVTNAQAYDQDTKVLNVGVGLGFNYYRGYKGLGYTYRSTPVFVISYEQAYKEKLGPGYLGIGALVTYQSSSSKYSWNNGSTYYTDSYHWSNYVIAARAVYHWDELIFEKGDVYGGLVIGPRFQQYRYSSDYNGAYPLGNVNSSSSGVHIVASALAGARWYFKPKFALYGEVHLGAGVPYLNGGITFKL
jgi:hypothetical protein